MEDQESRLEPMLNLIAGLGAQLEASASIVASVQELSLDRFDRLIVCGMGGSAAAAELIRGCYGGRALEMNVVRGYEIPFRLNDRCLVVFSSYSGMTEETVAAYDRFVRNGSGARSIVLSTGGALGERAERDGLPWFRLPPGLPPRASLGYGVGVLVQLLGRAGILPDAQTEIAQTVERLDEGIERWGPEQLEPRNNDARRLALALKDRLVLLYAGTPLTEAVAWRWKAQLNENAKCLAYVSTLPELNHNEVVGWERETAVRGHVAILSIRDSREHPRVSARFVATRDVLGSQVTWWEEIAGVGEAQLARAMGLVQLGDYVSVYLAGLHDVDPTPVERIDELKRRLKGLGHERTEHDLSA